MDRELSASGRFIIDGDKNWPRGTVFLARSNLRSIRVNHARPISLYLVVPPSDKIRLRPLIRLIFTMIVNRLWEPTLDELRRQHRFAVIGAGLAIPGSAAYENAALIIGGAKPQAFLQRVPVPVGMWRPFVGGPSVPLRVDRPGTIEIAGQRVAFLICYEQLLVLLVLLSATEHPTLIVGMANQYWVRETSIPAAQRASLMAWSRLFALPFLIAENK